MKFSLDPVTVSHQSLRISTNATRDHAITYQESPESPEFQKNIGYGSDVAKNYRVGLGIRYPSVTARDLFDVWICYGPQKYFWSCWATRAWCPLSQKISPLKCQIRGFGKPKMPTFIKISLIFWYSLVLSNRGGEEGRGGVGDGKANLASHEYFLSDPHQHWYIRCPPFLSSTVTATKSEWAESVSWWFSSWQLQCKFSLLLISLTS